VGCTCACVVAGIFVANDESDQQILQRLDESLQAWLASCEDAQFEEAVPLGVLREALLGSVDEQTLNHRFVSGGVTFCSLMPMRAVPFRVVCLLGMNDGDYPRRTQHVDFDLLAQAGMARPGDRSRRNDDRYLMLEALLAARDKLYISWVGRNIRDNTEQPASVLVTQLRDYLKAGWNYPLHQVTTEHALQAFSRRYFEKGGLLTYAREWRVAHSAAASQVANISGDTDQPETQTDAGGDNNQNSQTSLPAYSLEPGFILKISELLRFLRQPVSYFFRQRLSVIFTENTLLGEDDEPFALSGLEEYFLVEQLLGDDGEQESLDQVEQKMRDKTEALKREGVLAIGLVGKQWQHRLIAELLPIRQEWLKLCARYPTPAEKIPVSFTHQGIVLSDWLDKIYSNGTETVCLMQVASKVLGKKMSHGQKN